MVKPRVDRLPPPGTPTSSLTPRTTAQSYQSCISMNTKLLIQQSLGDLPVRSFEIFFSVMGTMRAGLYRPVHVKTLVSQKRRMLLTGRQLLQAKALDIENDLRGTLRNFGLKVGMVGTVKFEARIRELVAEKADAIA